MRLSALCSSACQHNTHARGMHETGVLAAFWAVDELVWLTVFFPKGGGATGWKHRNRKQTHNPNPD
jgi:hypothetical protein